MEEKKEPVKSGQVTQIKLQNIASETKTVTYNFAGRTLDEAGLEKGENDVSLEIKQTCFLSNTIVKMRLTSAKAYSEVERFEKFIETKIPNNEEFKNVKDLIALTLDFFNGKANDSSLIFKIPPILSVKDSSGEHIDKINTTSFLSPYQNIKSIIDVDYVVKDVVHKKIEFEMMPNTILYITFFHEKDKS